MKVLKSTPISAFGGMNFVHEYFNQLHIGQLCNKYLPVLAGQSKYSWKDIFYSFSSIYYCGGDCIEDLQEHLEPHFVGTPYFNVSSPDTVLRRLASLSAQTQRCKTKRGEVLHEFCTNELLSNFNINLLKHLGVFKNDMSILDYDNTIVFNEKDDSKMTYKRAPGYQPGVCALNEKYILYIENRNGNSDAKSFQQDTLKRLFDLLHESRAPKIKHFRADSASYQYDVVQLVQQNVDYFYIGCRNSYIEKYFSKITDWKKSKDQNGPLEIGSIDYTPFQKQASKSEPKTGLLRLVVKRRLKPDGQLDLLTQDAYEYRAILTNNFDWNAQQIATFYNRRGNMERQFDILKNDFGWNNMPFSQLNKNLVFLYWTAICRNLYNLVIEHFSQKVDSLKANFRMKKFIFRFIVLPAKWVNHARQVKLRIYSDNWYFT